MMEALGACKRARSRLVASGWFEALVPAVLTLMGHYRSSQRHMLPEKTLLGL